MRYEIRELTVGGILDQAIKLVTENFWLFFKIVLVLLLPVSLVGGLIISMNMPDPETLQKQIEMMQRGQQVDMSGMAGAGIAASLFSIVRGLVVVPLTDAALVFAIGSIYLGKTISLGEAFRRAGSVYLKYLGTAILFGLAIIAPIVIGGIALAVGGLPIGAIVLALMIVLAIVLGFWYALALRVVVLEGIAGNQALSRSKQLMKGNFGTFFVLGVLLFVIGFAVGAVTQFIPQPQVQVVFSAIVETILTIFVAAAYVVFYFSCRCKAENFDLTMLADAVATEEAPAMR
jgi:hypothetical protein